MTTQLQAEFVKPNVRQANVLAKAKQDRENKRQDLLTDVKSCCDIQWARSNHANAIESHLNSDIYVVSALIIMYHRCGSMVDACELFDSMRRPNTVHWNNLLLGCVENGDAHLALKLFSRMKARGYLPDSFTYVSALKACTYLATNGNRSCLELGRKIQSEIGNHLNIYLQNTLIDMYSKYGCMVDARAVFDGMQQADVVSWNSLLLGYAENGEATISLELFLRMKEKGCVMDSGTYVAALKACTSIAMKEDGSGRRDCLKRGREIHMEIGNHLDYTVQSTLIEMYSSCGSTAEARSVFESIKRPDVVSWTNMLLCYVDNGHGNEALDLFSNMKKAGCVPDHVTYIAVLKACGLVGALTLGRKVHSEISIYPNPIVTCLVDLYAKCGSMVEAREVFDLHSQVRTVETWTALLAGYGRFTDCASAFDAFEAMKDEGFRPNAVTFLCLLLCCSHAGLVEKAEEIFDAMTVHYGVSPTVKHYNCMVDALGRADQLTKAILMIRKMPCSPDEVTWVTLLGACRKWKNVEIGKEAFQALRNMKMSGTPYVLMADIYRSSKDRGEEPKTLLDRRNLIAPT